MAPLICSPSAQCCSRCFALFPEYPGIATWDRGECLISLKISLPQFFFAGYPFSIRSFQGCCETALHLPHLFAPCLTTSSVKSCHCLFDSFTDNSHVRTSCGHLFCGECLMQQRNHNIQHGGLNLCAVCRMYLRLPAPCLQLQAEIDALSEGFLDVERSSFVWFSSYESL